MRHIPHSGGRSGITLLEVMIAMGILTVGLASVAALIPAGRSQAVKASISDRSAAFASNTMADLINRGFLRAERLIDREANPVPTNRRLFLYDPFVEDAPDPAVNAEPLQTCYPRADAASGAVSTIALDGLTPFGDFVLRGEDDLAYNPAANSDDLPTPLWSNGTSGRHAFEGLYSFLATLETSSTKLPFWEPGTLATFTVVVFHRRPTNLPSITLIPASKPGGWEPVGTPSLPEGESLADQIPAGSLVLGNVPFTENYLWYRVLLATEDSEDTNIVYISADAELPLSNVVLYAFPGSTYSMQKTVRLEGTTDWNR